MNEADWIHTAITLAGMIFVASGFVWAIKGDTKLLAQRLDAMDKRLDRMDTVLLSVADTRARLDVFDERQLAQGRRLDEAVKRFTDFTERVYVLERKNGTT